MSLSSTLLLSTCSLLAPQDAAQDKAPAAAEPVLSKSDHEALRSKVRDYFSARAAVRDANENRRAAYAKREDAAKEKLLKDWENRAAKKNAIASVPDLRAIFDNCFEFERQTGTGDVRGMKAKDPWPAYDIVVPKKYRADTPSPTVLLMRGEDGDKWVSARDWYGDTWKAAAESADYVFVMPELDESIDFDPPVDLTKEEGLAQDGKRRAVVLGGLGAAAQELNVDRDKIFYDCGKGSCRYALQLATYSPHLFAGLVLRHPHEAGDLRIDSLAGVPILLLRTDATKAVCDKLAESLNKLEDGTATVLDAKGEYPHAESAPDIAAWMASKKRDMFRRRVVIGNNHDSLKRSFWVFMGTAEALADVAPGERPRLEVEADRASNKITVTSRGVSDFSMLLNDALVDLDKEVVTIINGEAQPAFKVERSERKLLDYVFTFRDSGMLFVAEKGFEVPQPKPEPGKTEKGDGSAAK